MKLNPIRAGASDEQLSRDHKKPKNPTESVGLAVTKIARQVKNTDRYSVYINEKYSFSLSEYQLASARLYIGKTFSQRELDDFIHESQFGKAYERALNYVMIRPRSRSEISDYLTRTFLYPKPKVYIDKLNQKHYKKVDVDKDSTQILIQRILERLEQKGYINDTNFAKAWVRSRQLTKKTSRRKLEQELRTKKVDPEVIATVLQSEDINESQNLSETIEKKRRQAKYSDDTKLTQYLIRQGYNYADIKNLL